MSQPQARKAIEAPPPTHAPFLWILAGSILTNIFWFATIRGVDAYVSASQGRVKFFGNPVAPWEAVGEDLVYMIPMGVILGTILGTATGLTLKLIAYFQGDRFLKFRNYWVLGLGLAFSFGLAGQFCSRVLSLPLIVSGFFLLPAFHCCGWVAEKIRSLDL